MSIVLEIHIEAPSSWMHVSVVVEAAFVPRPWCWLCPTHRLSTFQCRRVKSRSVLPSNNYSFDFDILYIALYYSSVRSSTPSALDRALRGPIARALRKPIGRPLWGHSGPLGATRSATPLFRINGKRLLCSCSCCSAYAWMVSLARYGPPRSESRADW